MPSKNPWIYKKRRRRSKKKEEHANQGLPPDEVVVALDANVEGNEGYAADANDVEMDLAANAEGNETSAPDIEIQVPSSAIMPARRVGESLPPLIVHPVKNEPIDMETGETPLDSDLKTTDDLPLNSQKAVSENVTSAAYVSQHEFENNKENVNYPSSQTNSCIPVTKVKEEPIDPDYDIAIIPSDMIDDVEHVRKKVKVELTDSDISVASVNNVKAAEQCNEAVANQNDDCNSVISTSIHSSDNCNSVIITSIHHSDDSNSTDTVLNMPIENTNVEQNTAFPSEFVKVKQESNSAINVSAEARTDKSEKDELVSIKKEPVDNCTQSLNSAELTKKDTTVINMTDVIDSKVLNEILMNIPLKSESVNAVDIPQSSVPLKSTSITETRGTESIDSSKTPEEKMMSLDNKSCSNSTISTSSWNSSESEQLEKSKTVSSVEWHGRNTSPVALSSSPNSNSRLRSSNITVGSLKKRVYLDFDLSDVVEALKYISKRTINKPDKILYPCKSRTVPMDDSMKLTCLKLANVEKEIEDLIFNIKRKSKEVSECKSRVESDYSQQKNMDVDRIVSPIANQESSLTRTCSDTSVEKDISINKSLFTSTKKIDSSSSKSLSFSMNVRPVLPSSDPSAKTDQISSEGLKRIMNVRPGLPSRKLSAKEDQISSEEPKRIMNVRPVLTPSKLSPKTDQISNEQLKRIMSLIVKENVLPSNLSPSYTSSSVTSADTPCAIASAKQSVKINNNTSDSIYDHSRNSIMNRPVRNFTVDCTDLNREHNFVSPSFIESDSANASYADKLEFFGKQSMNMINLNNRDYRNTDFEQNSVPTSHTGNISGIPSFIPPAKSSRNQDLSLVPGSSRNQDLSLVPGSSRNRIENKVTEMTVTNIHQQDSTPHTSKSSSLSFARDSVMNASRRTTNVTESTNVHNIHSSIHVPCNYENSKRSLPANVPLSDKSAAKLAVSGSVIKRKITAEEYVQRSKMLRVANDENRKLNSEYPFINSAKPSTTTEESLRMDSTHCLRDPRLRRNVACSSTSNVASHFVPTSAASGRVHSSILNSGISNFAPSDNIFASRVLECVPSSSKSAPSMGSTALINNVSVNESKRYMHSFPSHPYAASNISPSRTPISNSTSIESSDKESPILMPISQPEKLIHRNNSTSDISMQRPSIFFQDSVRSTPHVPSESGHRHVYFPPHRGNVSGMEQWRSNIGKKIVSTSDVLHFQLEWNFLWLGIQLRTQTCPPICDHYNEVKDNYDSVAEYYNTYFPLYMLNIWLKIYNSWQYHLYPVYDVKLHRCDETSYVKVSCTITMNSSQINDFLKREEIVYVRFNKDGKEDTLFGYIYMVGERPDTTRSSDSWKKVMVSFYTAEKLYIPVGSIVQIQKLENLRVLLKQHDALRSLEESPFKEVILKPKDHATKIFVVTLPNNTLATLSSIRTIASYTEARNRITLVSAPPAIDRTTVISKLVQLLNDKGPRVLVCLKDQRTLIELAGKLLKHIKTKEFVLALKPNEIQLPDWLARHTLRERIKIGGKDPSDSEAASLSSQILKDSSVILTVLASIFFGEGKSAFAESSVRCIIDDANSCTETETMLPLYYNVRHLVLIGDPQKEAMLNSNLQRYGYQKSLFSRLYKAKTIQ